MLLFLLYTQVRVVGIAQPVLLLAVDWTAQGSNPGGGENFNARSDRPRLLYNEYLQGGGGIKRPSGMLATHPLLSPKLGIGWSRNFAFRLCLHRHVKR